MKTSGAATCRRPHICAAVLAAVLVAVSACQSGRLAQAPEAPAPYRIVGYVTGRTEVWRVSAEKITHVNYAFAQVDEEGEIHFRDADAAPRLARIQALKARNPALKVLVSVGGWGADGFSDAAFSEESRERFARSAVRMIDRFGLDGIDIDWEFPGQPGPGIKHRPEDKKNFTLMLGRIREHVDSLSESRGRKGRDRYLLTIASNDDQRFFDHTEMGDVHRFLDFVNVMTYDMFSSGSPTTGHHTALYRSSGSNAPTRTSEAAVQRHIEAGIPREKIVLGVAFYGRGWEGVLAENQGLFQPYERFADAWGFETINQRFTPEHGFRRYWDDAAKASYLWNADSSMFISYDDAESLRHKVDFVRRMGLGGVMYWEHSHDPDEILLDAIYDGLQQNR